MLFFFNLIFNCLFISQPSLFFSNTHLNYIKKIKNKLEKKKQPHITINNKLEKKTSILFILLLRNKKLYIYIYNWNLEISHLHGSKHFNSASQSVRKLIISYFDTKKKNTNSNNNY